MTDRCITTTYPDGSYCVDCVEQPYIPDVPAHIDDIVVRAWNAGANRIVSIDNPCYMSFSPSAGTVGVFLGLFPAGAVRDVTNPVTLSVAWYVYVIGVSLLAQAYVAGVALGGTTGVTTSSVLRIEHFDSHARFLIDGTEVQSATTFEGAARCGASLYASGDNIQ